MHKWSVPRSRAYQSHVELRDEILKALEPVLFEPHQFDNAPLRALEGEFAQLVQRRHAFAVHSGTAGLFLALRACGVGPGDEVITVANSDLSTTAAISHCGATPVLCDVLASDHTLDVDAVAAHITPRTVAILPVDLYGYPADVKRLRVLADTHGIKIVEDATLALGASDHGKPAGFFSHVAIYSFGSQKPLGSAGNGGIIATDDDAIAANVQLLRSYGRSRDSLPGQSMFGVHVVEGYNLPMDFLQAAIVRVKLPYLAEWTDRRRAIAHRYATGIQDPRIIHPELRSTAQPTYYSYVVRVPARDAVYSALRDQGIEVGLHYVPPVHYQPVYQHHALAASSLPVTEQLAEGLLGLPIDPSLTTEEVDFVINALLRAVSDST
ncbi:hypothetical protein GC175_11975 [bacterium]|nr:hypothetical protein [bacterium]